MGVLEIAPGLYWSCIETDDGKVEIDLGCYDEGGPAGVAHDVMAFKLNSSSGEQRRLPDVDEDLLVLELSDYERIARDILKELKRSTEDLAVALKSKGLAVQLYNEMENDGAVAAPTAVVVAKPVAKRAAETSEKARSPDQKRSKSTKESPKVEKKKTASPKKAKKEAKPPKAEPKKEKTAATSTGDDVSPDFNRIWIKSNPEFPPKSGKYPCYCKHKPLHHGYFTVSTGVVKTILADFVHGEVEMVNVDNPSQTWKAAYTVKDAVHRVLGDHKGARYFTQISALRKALDLKEGDVVYFMEGDAPQQVKIGLWAKGSREAEKFTKALISDK